MVSLDDRIHKAYSKLLQVDGQLHSFVPERNRQSRLLADIKKLKQSSKSPLYGLLVGIKDIFRVDGLPTRAGSNLPEETFEGKQALVVTQLKQAGAVMLGKTVTTEFAFAEPNGTVNPANHAYSPGGSSSGSAAAVAAGLCDLGIGSQTVGSTLRPASYCGIVGFKCSYGRIATDGIIYFAPSLDTVGLLTKDIATLTTVAKIVLKNWQKEITITPQPILGIPVGKYLEQTDNEVLKIFEKMVNLLKKNGYIVKRIPMFEHITQINENNWTLASYEMAQVHKEWYQQYKHLYRKRTKDMIEKGLTIRTATYQEMLIKQKELRKYIEVTMMQNAINLWICPASTSYAPKMSEGITGSPVMNLPWTFAGLPSISLPIKNSGKLPLGMQIIAAFGQDEIILSKAQMIERIIN